MTAELARYGAYAIFLLMVVDALLPAAAELTMLYAGVLAAGHHASLFGMRLTTGLEAYVALALVGSAGALAGALLGWAIGTRGGRPLLEDMGAGCGSTAGRWSARTDGSCAGATGQSCWDA